MIRYNYKYSFMWYGWKLAIKNWRSTLQITRNRIVPLEIKVGPLALQKWVISATSIGNNGTEVTM